MAAAASGSSASVFANTFLMGWIIPLFKFSLDILPRHLLRRQGQCRDRVRRGETTGMAALAVLTPPVHRIIVILRFLCADSDSIPHGKNIAERIDAVNLSNRSQTIAS